MKSLSADFAHDYPDPAAIKKMNNGGDFGRKSHQLIILALLLLATYGFLYTQSYKAVDHGLHAVEVAPGKFIHGSLLDCTELGTGTSCRIDLDGKLLTIRTHYAIPVPENPIKRCTARFDNRHIDCAPDYLTGSYWPHGVSVRAAELDAAISQTGPMLSWQALLLGRGPAMLAVFILFAAIPLLSVVIIPTAIRTRFRVPRSWADLQLNVASVLMLLAMVPFTFVFMVFVLLRFGYID